MPSSPGRGEETLKLCVDLCRGWIFAEGARLLGAEAEWDRLLHVTSAPAVSSPMLFSGEEELFDVDALSQCFHEGESVGSAKSPLGSAWRGLVWELSCRSARDRFGSEARTCKWRTLAVSFSMEQLYRKIFEEIPSKGRRIISKASADLQAVWKSLEIFECSQGRPIARPWSHTEPADLALLWSTAARAWLHGWPRETESGGGGPLLSTDRAGEDPQLELTSIPREDVETLGEGWFKWRGFRKQAADFEEGWQLLNEAWREQQVQHSIVAKRALRRKNMALRSLDDDSSSRPGPIITLRHPRYKEVFAGRLLEDGANVTFIEEVSWLRVTVPLPEPVDRKTGTYMLELYDALRGDNSPPFRPGAPHMLTPRICWRPVFVLCCVASSHLLPCRACPYRPVRYRLAS